MISQDSSSFPVKGPTTIARVSLVDMPNLTKDHFSSSEYDEVSPPFDENELTFRSLCMWTEACKKLQIPIRTIHGGFGACYADFDFASSRSELFQNALEQLSGKLPVAGHVINLDGVEVIVVSVVDSKLNIDNPISHDTKLLQLDVALAKYFKDE